MKQRISILITTILMLFTTQIFAHGTEEEHQKEMMMSQYVFMGFIALFIVLFILWINMKYKAKPLNKKNSKILIWANILTLVGVLITGMIYYNDSSSSKSSLEEITMEHVHGLGYSADGRQIYFAVHDGLRMYESGQWTTPEGPKHDYMGFSMVDDGFYSSGHPAPGSNIKNPLGIIKSIDAGKTIEMLALYGEIDFHSMDASYNTHTIYVLNPQPNLLMETTGLHYSQDEAQTWTKSEMGGNTGGEFTALAVHPTNDAIVALGSQNGLFLSMNHGHQFEKIVSDRGVTTAFIGQRGQLFIGGYNKAASLLKINIETEQTQEIMIPTLEEDAISFFDQNPLDDDEMVFITFNKDVYLSDDGGASWNKIAVYGKGINNKGLN